MADFVFYNLFARLAISTVWLPFISHDLCLTLFPRSILSICVYIVLCAVVLVVIRSIRVQTRIIEQLWKHIALKYI